MKRITSIILAVSLTIGNTSSVFAVESVEVPEEEIDLQIEAGAEEEYPGITAEIVPPEGAEGSVLQLPVEEEVSSDSLGEAEDFIDEEISGETDVVPEEETDAGLSPEGTESSQEVMEGSDDLIMGIEVVDEDEIMEEASEEASEEVPEEELLEETSYMTFGEYLDMRGIDKSGLAKEQYARLSQEFRAYLKGSEDTVNAISSDDCWTRNAFLEVIADGDNGQFTIGTVEGNPNYSSDNNQKLLFGHPDPWSSETLLNIDGNDILFNADSVNVSGNAIIAAMNLSGYGITVVQTLQLINSGNVGYEDTVRISYQVINLGNVARTVGVRIMLDTMLADNDDAPFKIPGIGEQTTIRTFTGESIPQSYQVYDDLDNPTTLATGYLFRAGERRPDRVMFTHWPDIEGSSWSYTADDGDYLGDSAVGVVFNPVVLAGSGSMEVATYYGVSVGSTISEAGDAGSSESVRGDQFQVQVKDFESGQSIEGAEVVISSNGQTRTGTTDAVGKTLFDDVQELEGTATVTVSAQGYKTKTTSTTITGGGVLVVTVKDENSSAPEITSIKLGDVDLLHDTVNYVEDSNAEIAEAKNTEEIEIKATSDVEGCVFYLMQDESVIQKNETGVFKFKTLKKKNGKTVIEKLTADGYRYIKCVSPEGRSSQKTQFGLKVSRPTIAAKGITKMKFMDLGDSTVKESTFASLFLGGSKLKFGMTDLLDLEIQVDDSGKVRVGLNLSKMPQSQKDVQKLYNALYKMNSRDFKEGKKQPAMHLGMVTPKFQIGGYGEGWLEDGKVMIDLYIKASGSITAQYTSNFFWIVPLYITVGAEGAITAEVKGMVKNQEGADLNGILPSWYEGKVTPSLALFLEGGAGAKGIANLGVEGRATLAYSYDFVSTHAQATLNGSASLKAGIWKFEKSLKFADVTATLYDSNDKERTIYCSDEENVFTLLDEQPFELAERGYEAAYAAYDPESELEVGTRMDVQQPIVVSANGTQYRFMIRDRSDLEVINSSELVWQKKVDGSYTEPQAVEADGTSDFVPSVAVDSANQIIYIAWQDTKQAFSDDTVQIEDMAQAAEINVAVLDYGNNDEISVYTLTDNDVTDTIPSVAVCGGKAAVAWYHTANGALETEKESYIYSTYLSGDGAMDTVSQADLGTGYYVSEISLSVSGDRPTAICNMTTGDGASGLNDSRVIKYVSLADSTIEDFSAPKAEDGEEEDIFGGVQVGRLGSEECVFWYQNGNIAYRSGLTGETKLVFKESADIPQDFQVFSSEEKTYLVWVKSVDEAGNRKAAYGCSYENGAFSSIYKIGDLGEGNISSMTGLVEDGILTLTYQRTTYDENGNVTDNCIEEKTMGAYADIQLVDVEFDDAAVETGKVLPLELTVRNTGNTVVDNMTVTVDGAEAEVPDEVNIGPGETAVIEAEYMVDDPLDGLIDLTCEVSCENESDTENNSQEFTIGYTNVYAEQQDDIVMDNELYVVLKVINDSSVVAENVAVRVLADSREGAVLYTEQIESLEGRGSRTIYFPRAYLDECTVAYVYLSTGTPQRGEEQTFTIMSTSNEDIRTVVTSSFSIDAGSGGTIPDTEKYAKEYDSDTKIEISAEPDEGYVFDKWTVEIPEDETGEEGILKDRYEPSTIFTMPENAVALTASFKEKVDVETIELPEEEITMTAGETKQLEPKLTPADASDRVGYSSSNEAVVTVNKEGLMTAHKSGQATVTASCGEVSASCTIMVEDIRIENIRMVYPTIELEGVGAADVADIIITPEDATETVTFTSDNPGIVEVDSEGRLTAKAVGTAVITASSSSGVKASSTVTVSNPLQSITFSEGSVVVYKNEEKTLTLNYNPADTTDDRTVNWNITNTSVVDMVSTIGNQITVKGVGKGTALLEAKVGERVAYCSIVVNVRAESISLSSTALEMKVGQYKDLNYTLSPREADEPVTFMSSDPSVASVDEYGEVSALKPGTAVITVTTASGKAATCTVTVKEADKQIVNVRSLNDFQSPHNYQNNTNKYWVYNASGAESVTVVFDSSTKVDDGDYIEILSKDDTVIGKYTGTQLAGQTVTVPGTTVQVHLFADSSGTAYGFKVTQVTPAYNLSSAVVAAIPNQQYTGTAIVPALSVTHHGINLTNGVDYTVAVENNINIGTATVTITGAGLYSGTVSVTFFIVAPELPKITGLKTANATQKKVKITWDAVSNATGYRVYQYTNAKKGYVLKKTLKGSDKTSYTAKNLKKNKKYKYKVAAYFEQGTTKTEGPATELETSLAPKASKVKKLTSGSKKITVSFKKISKVSGYEIYVSTQKSTGYNLAAVKSAKKTKAVIKNLVQKKLYYVKIRSYVKTKDGNIYSAYSAPKKVRVK